MKKIKKNEWIIFIFLWLLGFVTFKAYPLVSSLIYSFSDFQLFGGISRWGFENYIKIFTDGNIIKSLAVTFRYAFITVTFKVILALFFALMLCKNIRGAAVFRTIFYIPSIIGSSAAAAVLWKNLFRDDGLINLILVNLGFNSIGWLSDTEYALYTVSMLKIWQFGSAMVLFIAALQSVDQGIYDAALIDGAGKIRKFFYITLPMITPALFYNLVTQFIQSLQEFSGPYMVTQGGPRNSTSLFALYIYRTAFQKNDVGMACALSWILFIITAVITFALFKTHKLWVYYDDEK